LLLFVVFSCTKKLATIVRVPQIMQNLANSYCFFAEDSYKTYLKIYNICLQPLFYSLHVCLLFGGIIIAIIV